MSDPYLNFNLQNIPFQIYKINSEKKELLDLNINIDDTIEDILYKITNNCDKKISDNFIYLWMENNDKVFPLLNNYQDINLTNPYLETEYDNNFVSEDNTKKLDIVNINTNSYTINEFIKMNNIQNLNIYYSIANEYLLSNQFKSLSQTYEFEKLFFGILLKYFPLITDIKDLELKDIISIRRNNIEYIILKKEKQEKIINQNYNSLKEKLYLQNQLSWNPNLFIFHNNENNNSINLYQLFYSFKLRKDIPYIRIYIDSYLDSCSKLLKTSILSDNYPNETKFVSKRIFEQWTKNIIFENGFNYPININRINTISLIIYDDLLEYYVTMIINLDGKIELCFEDKLKNTNFNSELINSLLTKCNLIIEEININNYYSEVNLPLQKMNQDFNLLNCKYYLNIPQYNVKLLSKIIEKFYSYFMIINDKLKKDDILHLYYLKKSNIKNKKYIQSFITKCNKKQIESKKILQLISERFMIDLKEAKNQYISWERLYESNNIKMIKDEPELSIFIKKQIDLIEINIMGMSGYDELNNLMILFESIFSIYNEKTNQSLSPKIEKFILNENITKEKNKYNSYLSEKEYLEDIIDESDDESDIEDDSIDDESDIFDEYDNLSDESDLDDSDDSDNEDQEQLRGTDDIDSDDSDDKLNDEIEQELDLEDDLEEPSEPIGIDDKLNDSDDSDNEGSDDDIEEYERDSDSQSGGSYKKKKKKGKMNESSFPNSRYYIKRLENADLKLFKYDSKNPKDKYAKKCQSSNNTQPLALTRDEYNRINQELEKYGQQIKQKAFSIAGRDPNILYICQEYWDRKNQLIIGPDDEENHPIEDEYIGDLIYQKNEKDKDNFILHRDNDKYQINFIQNIHPNLYSLPCCGKKNKNIFKVGDNVNVLVSSDGEPLWIKDDPNPSKRWENKKKIWEKGTIKEGLSIDDTYLIDVNGIVSEYHISMLDKYSDTGKLSQVFPLSQGSKGSVSLLLKNIFHIRDDCPNLLQKFMNGFYRIGIQQNNDSLLSSILIQINKYDSKIKLSLKDFKQNIINDLKHKKIELEKIADGLFINSFLSENYFLNHKFTIRDFLINYESDLSKFFKKNKLDFNKISDQEIINHLDNLTKDKINKINKLFIKKSSIHNFERYLFSEESKNDSFIISILNEISLFDENKTFNNKLNDLNVIIIEEKSEKIKIIDPIHNYSFNDKSNYSIIYKKEDKYEPLIYLYNNIHFPILSHKIDSKIVINKDILIDDTIGKIIKNLPNNDFLIRIINSDQEIIINQNDIILYDTDKIIQIIINNINYKPYIFKNESLPSDILIQIMKNLPKRYKYFESRTYYDNYNKKTHLTFRRDIKGKTKFLTLPIRPEKINNNLRPILKLPKQKLKDILKILSKIDGQIIKNFNEYNTFLNGNEKVLIDSQNEMKYLYFENGSFIKLDNQPFNQKSKYNINISYNEGLISLIDNIYIISPLSETYFSSKINEINNLENLEYKFFTDIYLKCRENQSIIDSIQKIKNHPIKISIHKRKEILSILLKHFQSDNLYLLKKFIEYLYLNDINDLDKIFIYTYLSLNKINKETDNEYIFAQREILNNEHNYIFINNSLYLRNVSLYDNHNPHINLKLINMKERNNLVSFYTRYPYQLKLYFGQFIKISKLFIDSITDFHIIDYSLKNDELTHEIIQNKLIQYIELNPDIIQKYNEISHNEILSEKDLINMINKSDYLITYYDLYILSLLLSDIPNDTKYGFCLYTNQYSNNPQKYQLFIIIHDDLLKGDLMNIQMISFYQDIFQKDDKNLKNIIYPNDTRTIHLQYLYSNESFKKLWKEYDLPLL